LVVNLRGTLSFALPAAVALGALGAAPGDGNAAPKKGKDAVKDLPCALADTVRPGDGATLRSAIGEALAAPDLEGVKIGALVKDLATGEVLFALNPDVALHPASNMKILTSAAALHYLGPAYRFSTTIYFKPDDRTGAKLAGALYLKGGGDPRLTTEELHKVADEIALAGITEVTGGLVIDQSFFDAGRLAPGYDEDPEEDHAFRAMSTAAALNFNALALDVRPSPLGAGAPAVVRPMPASSYVEVEGSVATLEAGKPTRLKVECAAEKDHDKCAVSGSIGADGEPERAYRRVSNPSLHLATALWEMLEARGVKVSHKLREGAVPGAARELYRHKSDQLGALVRDMNKVSSNFMAEQILRTIGAEVKGVGSWAAGIEAVREWVTTLGVPAGAITMVNGSGLFGAPRVAPAHFVKVLEAVARDFTIAPDFVASLAIASADGTIKGRMGDCGAAKVLRAKTGTLDDVTALSGYVAGPGGELVAFSILMNDVPVGKLGKLWAAQDQIGASIAAYLAKPALRSASKD
jgi:D-alanyl-D-alanine carboxypeptidase/D-alanyl-D-alanine-endopeptidase (penicillin-binding protein 4)